MEKVDRNTLARRRTQGVRALLAVTLTLIGGACSTTRNETANAPSCRSGTGCTGTVPIRDAGFDTGKTDLCRGGHCVTGTTRDAGPDAADAGPGNGDPPGSCLQRALPQPCPPERLECIPDFRAARSRYPACNTGFSPAPFRVQCEPYEALLTRRTDGGTVYFFDKTDGHLAGLARFGLTTLAPCEAYDRSFRVPKYSYPPACAGECPPVTARTYDPVRDCYGKEEPIAGLCLRETEPLTTSGLREMTCLRSPGGTQYALWKGITECLEVGGSATDAGGWSVFGYSGLCEGQPAAEPDCGAAGRGTFNTRGGLGDGRLLTSDAGASVGQCP